MNSISEVRVLVFSLVDMKKALDRYLGNPEVRFPDREIKEVYIDNVGDRKIVSIIFSNWTGLHEKATEIDAEAVQECLVRLCIERKIPIPKNSEKSIEVVRGAISMWINVNSSDELRQSLHFNSDSDKASSEI